MADLDTKWLRAAVVLAEELNFCRAAQKLHIGQSTLTKKIHALENFLGLTLFIRDSRKVSLTPAGEKFVPEARIALCTRNAQSNLPARRTGIARLLCISASPRIPTRIS